MDILNFIEDSHYGKTMLSIDRIISKNLKEAGIEKRPARSNGLWCFTLLPTILILNCLFYDVSNVYKLVSYVSLSLFMYSILFLVFLSISCLVLRDPEYAGCLPSSLISLLLVLIHIKQDILLCSALTVGSVYAYCALLRYLLVKCPKTYTVGEAMVVAQGVILFGVLAVGTAWYGIGHKGEVKLVEIMIYTVLSTVGLIVTALNILEDNQRNIQNLAYIFLAAAVVCLLVLHIFLGLSCLMIIFEYLFMHDVRLKVILFWFFLLVIAMIVLFVRTNKGLKATTVTRKTFHVLASLVFLSGILIDIHLMRLAAGLGLGLIILTEALRKSNVQPISSQLQNIFHTYSDEKDCGCFAMTPIYLYAGLACPLILSPENVNNQLELLSGILAIGIGDTCASWVGYRFGTVKWKGSSRTVEGTIANIVSQVIVVALLEYFKLLTERRVMIRTVFAATVSSLVEAKTDQVDNLILPLTTILALQVISKLF